jgi:hypothetical protein
MALQSSPERANDLSDELLEHMLDCELCLKDLTAGSDVSCPLYTSFQERIKACGGATKGLVVAY